MRKGPPGAPVLKAGAAARLAAATTAHGAGQLDEAARLYAQTLAADRGNFRALLGLGIIRLQQGRPGDAVPFLEKASEANPSSVEALGNLGNALQMLGRSAEAAARFERALALEPGRAETYNNLGVVLWKLGRQQQAFARFATALALKPANAEAHNNWALALKDLLRYEEAIGHWQTAQAIAPTYGDAHWNESLARLALGQYEIGWRKFEWRWAAPGSGLAGRSFRQPLWRGGDLTGKTILLHAEQGLGDTLQFARYVPLVAARGGRILLEVQAPLVGLMATLAGAGTIRAQGTPLPPFDVHCPLMSLPFACGTRFETIPAAIPYLKADPTRVASWRRRIEELGGFRVGLVWAGSPRLQQAAAQEVDRRRSITLAHLAPLADVPGVTFVSLQKGDAAAQIRKPPSGMVIHDWTSELKDFADTAALITALDLVISVDTSVVHAAGALGAPVWMLNRYDSCWRWLLGRNDSPWYPSLRQFRQPAPGDWASVLATVRQALAQRAVIRAAT